MITKSKVFEDTYYITCPVCNGAEETDPDLSCDTCQGTGQIDIPDPYIVDITTDDGDLVDTLTTNTIKKAKAFIKNNTSVYARVYTIYDPLNIIIEQDLMQ